MNVASLVLERARSDPDATAILHRYAVRESSEVGRAGFARATNAELDRDSDWLARGLESVGIERGTRTALMVRPSLELFALMLALFKVGAVPVLIDPGIGLRRLRRCLDEAEPEAFIGIPTAQAARVALGWARRTLRITVTVGRRWLWRGPTLDELRARGRSDAPYPVAHAEDDDVAAILFTSGSTGPPKGVVYCHGHFAAQIEAIRGLGQIEPGEIDLPTFPPFALFDPALGMTALIPEMDPTRPGSVDPRRIIEPAETFGATNLFGSPALIDTVGRYGVAHGVRLTTLRRVVSAGAPVSASIMSRLLEMLPDDAEILTPYGATECLPVSCISSREVLSETAAQTDRGAGVCVGFPVPSIDARIIAIEDGPIALWESTLERPRGEIGEIVVRGPQATSAYHNRPDATALAKIRDPDGGTWHRMGDVGYLDERGRLWYCGRKTDRVTTPDATLHSTPCEAVFETHSKVRRAALVGVGAAPDQEPVLCVELQPRVPRRSRHAIEQELLEIAARHAHTLEIRRILFRRHFPVDIRHNAKIGRPELARWATRKLEGRRNATRAKGKA
jgi:acyl-CoA synthetase (AMP-forming)/AMP-acid ligase II